ncbi:MAG: RNA polymerase sigma factor [Planctomycetota bacterium]|jgi:RNA polymerase sigma-70 factor (ECF subfamily)
MDMEAHLQPRDVAIPKLLEEFGSMVYSLGLRLCGSADEANDLVQETFLAAYKGWDQFEGRSSPKTWLYTIAARSCSRMHRLRVGQPKHMQSLEDLLPFGEANLGYVDPATKTPLDEEILREGKARIEEAIIDLPVDFRLPLILKDILGLPVKEVAEILDMKPATVKTRVHRARLRLRQALEAVLPHKEVPPATYSVQVCMDLLRLKQETLDRGETSTPELDKIVCQRCETIFDTLETTKNVCQEIGEGRMPKELRDRILIHFRESA